jgi:hypothetical protein
VGGPDVGRLDPYWEVMQALTAAEGGILGQGVSLVSPSVSLPHLCLHLHCKNLYRNLTIF